MGIHSAALGLGVLVGGLGSQPLWRSARAFEARLEALAEAAPFREPPAPLQPEIEEPDLDEAELVESSPDLEAGFAPDPEPPRPTPLDWPSRRPWICGPVPERNEPDEPVPEVVAASAPQALEPAVVDAAPVFAPPPPYPRRSIRSGEEGSVLVQLELSADGRVEHARVLESSGHERLDEAACETLRTWRFAPRTLAGLAVRSEFTHRVTFRLDRS